MAAIYYTLARWEVSEKVAFWVVNFGNKIMKTGFQSSIKNSAENRHPFYEILGPFWGPFLSKKSVVCRSKMSLTYGPLKIVILGPSGHPKSTKFEVIF